MTEPLYQKNSLAAHDQPSCCLLFAAFAHDAEPPDGLPRGAEPQVFGEGGAGALAKAAEMEAEAQAEAAAEAAAARRAAKAKAEAAAARATAGIGLESSGEGSGSADEELTWADLPPPPAEKQEGGPLVDVDMTTTNTDSVGEKKSAPPFQGSERLSSVEDDLAMLLGTDTSRGADHERALMDKAWNPIAKEGSVSGKLLVVHEPAAAPGRSTPLMSVDQVTAAVNDREEPELTWADASPIKSTPRPQATLESYQGDEQIPADSGTVPMVPTLPPEVKATAVKFMKANPSASWAALCRHVQAQSETPDERNSRTTDQLLRALMRNIETIDDYGSDDGDDDSASKGATRWDGNDEPVLESLVRSGFFDASIGTGADIDLSVDSNLDLVIKLQVLRSDDEVVVKIARLSLLEACGIERPVHLLVTSMAIYILAPTPRVEGRPVSVEAVLSLPELLSFDVLHEGIGFRMKASPGTDGRKRSWIFLSGDLDVSESMCSGIRDLCVSNFTPAPPKISHGADVDRAAAVERLLESEADGPAVGAGPAVVSTLAYLAVDPGIRAMVVVAEGLLYVKEESFFSASWNPRYFRLEGAGLEQFESTECARAPVARYDTASDEFSIKDANDEDRPHCFQLIGGSSGGSGVKVSAASRAEGLCWIGALQARFFFCAARRWSHLVRAPISPYLVVCGRYCVHVGQIGSEGAWNAPIGGRSIPHSTISTERRLVGAEFSSHQRELCVPCPRGIHRRQEITELAKVGRRFSTFVTP